MKDELKLKDYKFEYRRFLTFQVSYSRSYKPPDLIFIIKVSEN